MKIYGKDNGVWREVKRAVLAGLLCLPFYSAVAGSITPVTGGKMETGNPVPEGYRLLPVTEFVVGAEKTSATYSVTVGIEYSGEAASAQDWLERNFTGRIDVYKIQSSEPMYSYFAFNKKGFLLGEGTSGIISGKVFEGEQFSLKLEKGNYIISPKIYSINNDLQYVPHVYIFFKKENRFWW